MISLFGLMGTCMCYLCYWRPYCSAFLCAGFIADGNCLKRVNSKTSSSFGRRQFDNGSTHKTTMRGRNHRNDSC